jgi:putative transposase
MAEAVNAGARKHKACAEVGISLRTYQRWTQEGTLRADRRATAKRPVPANKLSEQEREQILDACNQPE